MNILLLSKFKTEYYVDAVASMGHNPLLDTDNLDEIDGVILCGGSDVHPKYYGQQINGAKGIDEERDEREVPIVRECIQRGIPMLGICRGHQLLNALLGGTLIQHLENVDFHNKAGSDVYQTHTVQAVKGSIYESLYGESFVVNTSHHQAVDRLAEGLRPTIYASDGVLEGFEHETLPIVGVQFHPERMMLSFADEKMADGSKIFAYFFDKIAKYKNSRDNRSFDAD